MIKKEETWKIEEDYGKDATIGAVGSQYGKLYYGEPISMGRRVAIEIKNATKTKRLKEIAI